MKTKLFFLTLSLGTASLLLSGCGITGPSSPPPVTVEAEYGNGFGNFGYGVADSGVTLHAQTADPSCPNQLNDQKTTASNGQAQFQIPCTPMSVQFVRYRSNNCTYTNGFDVNGQATYVYNNITLYQGNSPPEILPCGEVNPLAILDPARVSASGATEVQLSTQPGSFIADSGGGMPIVYFSDELGDIFGPVVADSVSADGSSITFSTQALYVNDDGTAQPDNYLVAALNATGPGICRPWDGSLNCTPPTYAGVAGGTLTVGVDLGGGGGDPGPGPCLPHRPCMEQ